MGIEPTTVALQVQLAPLDHAAPILAGEQGLEPRFSGPEPDVLPLDDSPLKSIGGRRRS